MDIWGSVGLCCDVGRAGAAGGQTARPHHRGDGAPALWQVHHPAQWDWAAGELLGVWGVGGVNRYMPAGLIG